LKTIFQSLKFCAFTLIGQFRFVRQRELQYLCSSVLNLVNKCIKYETCFKLKKMSKTSGDATS